ncbi:MAG: helix-turn-helix transcriptional regulator [Thermomicrobiales bacterium]
MATLSSRLEERTISEVRRLSQSGLESPQLLHRVAHALQRSIPFTLYAGAMIDPASKLITHAFAGRADKGSSDTRPVNPGWFQHFYFEETYGKTLEMIQRGRLATSLARETDGRLDMSLCYRESMRPAGIAHKAHTLFFDRNLWGDMELYRSVGDSEFSHRELELLQRLAPDIGSGLKFAALRTRAATTDPDATTPGVLIFDAHGRATSTPAAEALLSDLGELHPRWREAAFMPTAVQVVLRALGESLAEQPGVASRMRVRGRSGRWLALHAASSEATDLRPEERTVIIAPAPPQDLIWLGMAAHGLSAREEEVARLVVGGLSTRQISDRLFIAEHTVQRHLTNIFEKVGVRSRRDLVKHLFFEQMLPAAYAA